MNSLDVKPLTFSSVTYQKLYTYSHFTTLGSLHQALAHIQWCLIVLQLGGLTNKLRDMRFGLFYYSHPCQLCLFIQPAV